MQYSDKYIKTKITIYSNRVHTNLNVMKYQKILYILNIAHVNL